MKGIKLKPIEQFVALEAGLKKPFLPNVENLNENNAGIDVIANSIEICDDFIKYTLGFATAFDNNKAGIIIARSSLCNYNLFVCNHIGLIDSNFRNEWQMRFKFFDSTNKLKFKKFKRRFQERKHNDEELNRLLDKYKVYKVGDRIGQMFFIDLSSDGKKIEIVNDLDSTERTGGFGSTGIR